jgi:probable F420-dependent oxidoreductase
VTRERLGRIGVWTSAFGLAPAAACRAALAEIEALGYGAVWYPEAVGSKEALSQAAMLLSWSERLAVAPGIANIYARDPMAMVNGGRGIAEAYPRRLVLGIGVSHAPAVAARGGSYGRPVATMRAYLDAMDEAPYRGPEPSDNLPIVLAALGPRMLELAAERTHGAHPYFVPVAHTRIARERLGPEPLLAPEQAVVLETDAARAREIARGHTVYYLALDNYRRNLLRLGFAEDELDDGGSDRVVDELVAWGDVDAIRDRVRAHFEAGADHVSIQPLPPGEFCLDQLRALAPALVEV